MYVYIRMYAPILLHHILKDVCGHRRVHARHSSVEVTLPCVLCQIHAFFFCMGGEGGGEGGEGGRRRGRQESEGFFVCVFQFDYLFLIETPHREAFTLPGVVCCVCMRQ